MPTTTVRRTGLRVDLFVDLTHAAHRAQIMGPARQGIVLDVVTETYHRPRRRWSLERHDLAASLPRVDYLHEQFDVPLVLVRRHKRLEAPHPWVLMPWRDDDGVPQGARGVSSGEQLTGEILARFPNFWEFTGRCVNVLDLPTHQGLQWTPITDTTDS